MDSGNSGSLQSSSGGEEEYDSRTESSLPAFLTPSHFGPLSSSTNPQPSLLPLHHQPNLLDPSPNLFHAFSQSPTNPINPNSPFLNRDVVRPGGLRSNPNCTNLGNNPPGSSSSSQSVMDAQGSSSSHQQGPLSSMQLQSVRDDGARSSSPSDQTHVVNRNPKKRTRASRRAPTTVLTTDTSNFRAMVQEFTGIPAPPFSGSPYSRRLDLFGTGSSMRSGHLEPMGSLYPLRPSAQKVHQLAPFVSSSSSFLNNTMVDATINIASTTNNNNTITTSISATTTTSNPSSINYQVAPDLGLPKPPQNLINMHNQLLSFPSLLQPPPLHQPSLNVSGLGAKSQASLPLPSLEELGMSHGHVNVNLSGLQGHVTTEGIRLRSDNSSWRDGVGVNHGSEDHHLRSFDGNYGNSQRVNSSCKFNFSTPSSDFHHDKSLENVSSRGEGTVDSWICPSE